MHYYQFNIGDYARDTGHLSILEHGVYRLILDWCYLNEKPITTEQAIRVSRGNPTETQSVLSEFFIQESGGWVHKRVVKEITDYHEKVDKNRRNGAKGGRPVSQNNPVGSQTVSQNNPNQEPITKNQEPKEDSAPQSVASLPIPEKSAARPAKPKIPPPDDVAEQVWLDWLTLRRGKNASVTETVIAAARRDAKRVGATFEEFLTEWCLTGWQGFCAEDFLKRRSSKTAQSGETPYQRSMRERVEQMAPRVAAKPPSIGQVIDIQAVEFFERESRAATKLG